MKVSTFLKCSVLAAGILCATALTVSAQGGGGGGGGRGGFLTPENRTAMQEAAGDMTALATKLTEAQKAVVKAALAANASEATVKPLLEKVNAIQLDMALLRLKGVKAIKFTDEQKTAMDGQRDGGYMQLFGMMGGRGGGGRRGAGN